MNSRKYISKNQDHSEIFALSRNPSKENGLPHHQRTQRKSIASIRNPLNDLTLNQFATESHKPQPHTLERQASVELKHTPSHSSSRISSSHWLNSEQEMMEFILNLKSKKTENRTATGRKGTEGFELEERSENTGEMLCNKMLVIKKVEKHEKEAISHFYEKDYSNCFNELSKAQSVLKKQKVDSPQHQLYISYLYSQFYYKLDELEQWKSYLLRAKSLVAKIGRNQIQSMKEYILNIKALEVCLALHEQQFERVLHYTEELRSQHPKLSSKIRRRTSIAQITAFRKLCRFKQAIQAIDKECEALEQDQQVNEQKRQMQFVKLLETKVQITAQFISNESAIDMLEKFISFQQVAKGDRQNFSYFNSKIFSIFAALLKKNQLEKIKLVFFYQKWFEIQPSKKQKLKISLELFKLYYEMGIYQKALELFDSISSENVVYLGPQYLFLLAKIKHFQGQNKQAISIITKIIDICPDLESKSLYMYRILQFNLQQVGDHLRQQRQKLLQRFLKGAHQSYYGEVVQLYGQYLRRRGETQRSKNFVNTMKKTPNFSGMFSQKKNDKKYAFKR